MKLLLTFPFISSYLIVGWELYLIVYKCYDALVSKLCKGNVKVDYFHAFKIKSSVHLVKFSQRFLNLKYIY